MEQINRFDSFKTIKYPLLSHVESDLFKTGSDDFTFVEQIAEQSIAAGKKGMLISDEAFEILDLAGANLVEKANSEGKVSDSETRLFDKIILAVKMSFAVQEKLDETAYDVEKKPSRLKLSKPNSKPKEDKPLKIRLIKNKNPATGSFQ